MRRRPLERSGISMVYNRTADRLTFTFAVQQIARSFSIRLGVEAHFTAHNRLVAIEVRPARRVIPHDVLLRLTSPVEHLTLREAAREANLSPTTLRVQIRNGRLRAVMRGRDWLVTRDELASYLAHRGEEMD